jgi:hypothetical protein
MQNDEIRRRRGADETSIELVKIRGLKWFGHLMQMKED